MVKIKTNRFVAVAILLALFPFFLGGCWQYSVSPQITQKQVVNKLESLVKEYNDTIWDEWYAGGMECYAFAHYVFNNCFERDENKKAGDLIHYGEDIPMWIFEKPACDVYIPAQLNVGYTKKQMLNFLKSLKPGDYLQMQWRDYWELKGVKYFSYHSAIVYEVDLKRGYIWYFDANYVSKNRVKKHSISFEDFYKKIYGITAYRYWNYVD